ncbi:MAG TPA: cellulase family glycosylhydrolase [Solirubrobacteraceae bacterium]|nr:cellulase family glycosylhydrolase [Solirubrobacteraceae bacterium]
MPRTVSAALRRLALAAAAVSALAAAAPAGASAAQVGVNVDGMPPQQAIDQASAVGATWVRTFVRWDVIEPQGPGRWDPASVQNIDNLVGLAQARGIKVLAVVVGAPQWANGSTDLYVPPRDPADLARFMGSFAARYKGRIAAWEVWNEPDESDFWHGSPPSPAAYAALLQPAYKAVKDADPGALVYAGPLTGNDYAFLQGLYDAGAGGAFDGVAVHTDTACSITPPDSYYRDDQGRVGQFSFLGFREVHAVMDAHGDGAKPIVMSELGWSATATRCARGAYAGKKAAGVSEAEQAANLKLAYHCLAGYPYVAQAMWFSMKDYGQADTELNRYGLLRFDGSQRPAFAALSDIGHHGDRMTGACGDFDPPSISVLNPTTGRQYDKDLLISASAKDAQSPLGRITFYANGQKIRSFTTGLQNGKPVQIDWMGARNLPMGPVKVTIEALDQFGNTSTQEIDVVHADAASLPAQKTVVKLKVSGKGLKRTVRGSVKAPGTTFPVTGKILVQWQYSRKGHWVTLHKASRNANKPFVYTQRLAKPGRWRVVAQYKGQKPFNPARSAGLRFSAH